MRQKLVALHINGHIGQVKKTHFSSRPSPIYSSYSFQRSFPLSKFEKAFEPIRKNDRVCNETLKRYSFRKPKREEGTSEQVDLKRRRRGTICNNIKKHHHNKRILPRSRF
jgi:hypothetical protein